MKTGRHQDAKAAKVVLLCALCAFVSAPSGAGDMARVDALLVQAQALLAAARTELAAAPAEPPAAEGRIDLATFAWAASSKPPKTADPTGLPAGPKYGEGVEKGRRICQWWWPSFILHAHIIPASRTTATGASVVWYHFTTSGKPAAGLAHMRWTNTHQTRDAKTGVLWYRWAGAK